ncbi:hypothetical protein [Phenylobacterium sp.]|uniref:terminase small subunit-like protein n=1 Tax=Phenylobacterium sp. TaxID=1871053 RepID=UPI0035B12153
MPKRTHKPPARRPRIAGRVIRACYTPELATEICRRIAAGEAWRRIAGRGRMPAFATLYAWRDKRPAFAEALAQAREIAAEGGGDLPCNLHLIEGDPMKEREVAPKTKDRRRPRKADGSMTHVFYSKKLAETICERLASGESWVKVCRGADMPSYRSFYRWREKHPEFFEAVEEARRAGAEARFEQAVEVAMDATAATVQADKLKVSTLLHCAERMDRARFGPGGKGADGDGGQVQTFVIRRFERIYREDGSSYMAAIDTVQEVAR